MSARKRMRILLTGAAGALGSAVREMADATVELVCMDVKTDGEAAIREGTFTDVELMRELLQGCDAVIHTALFLGGHRQTHTPAQCTGINVVGFFDMMELCVELGVKRFVFSSSMEVLIGRDWLASGMAVVDESTPPNPDWGYPLNKVQCEQAGLYYHRFRGLEFVALRYMGFGRNFKPSVRLLARDVAPRDVAAANLLAATRPGLGYEVLNIGPETPLTNQDILQAQTDPEAVIEKYWPGSAARLKEKGIKLESRIFWPVTRIDRAKQILGWQPRITFAGYLESLGWQRPEA